MMKGLIVNGRRFAKYPNIIGESPLDGIDNDRVRSDRRKRKESLATKERSYNWEKVTYKVNKILNHSFAVDETRRVIFTVLFKG